MPFFQFFMGDIGMAACVANYLVSLILIPWKCFRYLSFDIYLRPLSMGFFCWGGRGELFLGIVYSFLVIKTSKCDF